MKNTSQLQFHGQLTILHQPNHYTTGINQLAYTNRKPKSHLHTLSTIPKPDHQIGQYINQPQAPLHTMLKNPHGTKPHQSLFTTLMNALQPISQLKNPPGLNSTTTSVLKPTHTHLMSHQHPHGAITTNHQPLVSILTTPTPDHGKALKPQSPQETTTTGKNQLNLTNHTSQLQFHGLTGMNPQLNHSSLMTNRLDHTHQSQSHHHIPPTTPMTNTLDHSPSTTQLQSLGQASTKLLQFKSTHGMNPLRHTTKFKLKASHHTTHTTSGIQLLTTTSHTHQLHGHGQITTKPHQLNSTSTIQAHSHMYLKMNHLLKLNTIHTMNKPVDGNHMNQLQLLKYPLQEESLSAQQCDETW
jgi:hypothetical protein